MQSQNLFMQLHLTHSTATALLHFKSNSKWSSQLHAQNALLQAARYLPPYLYNPADENVVALMVNSVSHQNFVHHRDENLVLYRGKHQKLVTWCPQEQLNSTFVLLISRETNSAILFLETTTRKKTMFFKPLNEHITNIQPQNFSLWDSPSLCELSSLRTSPSFPAGTPERRGCPWQLSAAQGSGPAFARWDE